MKSFDKGMVIGAIELVEKEGGRSGHYTRRVRVVEKSEPVEIQASTPKEEENAPEPSGQPRALLTPVSHPGERDRTPTPPPPVPHADSIARAKFVRSIQSMTWS